jgi:isopentenyl diphosphate isomerase/L-lactate dehydrogenase-like FMN-dependent dehydrogenase
MTAESFIDRRTRELLDREEHVPLDYETLRETAREHLPRDVYDYVAGGAGREDTVRANRAAFDRYRIVPRVLRDISERDLSTMLLGKELTAPVGLAPVGGHAAYHQEGELAAARAAADLGVPFTLATGSTRTIEEVATAMDEVAPDSTRLFQLYWPTDWDVAASVLGRAEAAGYDAVVVTLDSQINKWRRRNLENGYSLGEATAKATFLADPVVERKAEERGITPEEFVNEGDNLGKDASLTWDDLPFLREHTELPIVLKGIVHPGDAERALSAGADGLVVSTHGGRQIDGAYPALEALPDVVEVVDGEVPVVLDSGIRTGADVFKALALGADAAFVGRPFVFGLAIDGQRGVSEVLANVVAEFDSILGLSGHATAEAVDRAAVVRKGESLHNDGF